MFTICVYVIGVISKNNCTRNLIFCLEMNWRLTSFKRKYFWRLCEYSLILIFGWKLSSKCVVFFYEKKDSRVMTIFTNQLNWFWNIRTSVNKHKNNIRTCNWFYVSQIDHLVAPNLHWANVFSICNHWFYLLSIKLMAR